jgi:hypothetical protein
MTSQTSYRFQFVCFFVKLRPLDAGNELHFLHILCDIWYRALPSQVAGQVQILFGGVYGQVFTALCSKSQDPSQPVDKGSKSQGLSLLVSVDSQSQGLSLPVALGSSFSYTDLSECVRKFARPRVDGVFLGTLCLYSLSHQQKLDTI